MMSSAHQTQGPTQGYMVDPETLKLQLDSPAVLEAIRLTKVRPPVLWRGSRAVVPAPATPPCIIQYA